ncbi:MAG TPA: ABC transporter permease [Candidatus Limnocylindrales bacterium]
MTLAPLKSLTRISSFVGKELTEVARRPGALLSLILGPFLIMALFGAGYNGLRRPLDTLLVIPPGSGLSQDVGLYQGVAGPAIHVVGLTADRGAAEDRLRRQQVDLVIVAPTDAKQRFEQGQQSTIDVEYDLLDPVMANYVDFVAYRIQQEVNHEIVREAVGQGEQTAAAQGAAGATKVPPDVVASPTKAQTENVAPTQPGVVLFYGPAVLALILQHLAVTLTALSLVRERLSGAFELFRVSPVGALEILAGKYIAFGLLNLVIAAIVTALLVGVFHIPLLAGAGAFAAVVALLTFASLGVGLLISIVADSERQAVQLSLLLLLASVFFSGFVLPVSEFTSAVQVVAYALPVTHGIRLIQDLMLRGETVAVWEVGVLALIAAVCFVATFGLLRRRLAHG